MGLLGPLGAYIMKSQIAGAWLGVTAICLSFSPARANIITVFNLTGTFTDSSTISGTVTIDVTFGIVDSANLLYMGNTYSTIQSQIQFTGITPSGFISSQVDYAVDIGTSISQFPSIHLGIPGIPQPIFLTGYVGGPVCSVDAVCGPDAAGNTYASAFHPSASSAVVLQTGQLSVTPLPAALPLFATGLGAMGLFGWRRKRKAQAVA